jgi:hypothetical protein
MGLGHPPVSFRRQFLCFVPQGGRCNAKGGGVRPITLHRGRFPYALIALLFLGAGPLWAQTAAECVGITEPSVATSLPYYGDFYGDRKWLNDSGITYNLIYTNDVLGNMSGGISNRHDHSGQVGGPASGRPRKACRLEELELLRQCLRNL